MRTILDEPIRYFLHASDQELEISDMLGKPIRIEFDGKINCVKCEKGIRKTYGDGFCYDCFSSAPEAAECIIRPELCEAHLGKGRDPEWEKAHHAQPHVVYLALSSAVKVGVTRETQVPTRWIDQGANKALVIAKVPYRRLAGEIEVALKEAFTDRTNWRKMLTNDVDMGINLKDHFLEAASRLPEHLREYLSNDEEDLILHYPVLEFPSKVKSVGLDKHPVVEGVLNGIKGQYLLLDGDRVMNIRKHTGYTVNIQS